MLSMKPSVLLLFFALLLLLLMLLFVILSCIMQHWFYMSSFQLEAEIKKKEKNVVKKNITTNIPIHDVILSRFKKSQRGFFQSTLRKTNISL